MKRLAMMVTMAGLLCGSGWAQAKKQDSASPAKKAPATKAAPGAKAPAAAAAFNRALLNPAALVAKAPAEYEVKFATSKGEFVVKVTRALSPKGADRFYNLVKNGFYDGSSFFRVAPGFVVQFGVSAYPQVSEVWREARIKDDPVAASNKKGFVTFATGGADTRTTQVFISLKDNSRLDGMGFSPFGEVTQGMEVVESLYSGYGDGPPFGPGPDQGKIQAEGRKYLETNFPKLDSITRATVSAVAAAGPAPAAKKSPAKKAPAKAS